MAVIHLLKDFGLWVFFFLGQALHVYLQAWAAVVNVEKPELASYSAYFARYRPVLIARAFTVTCLFMGGMVAMDAYIPGAVESINPLIQVAAAGLTGLASDNILERFQDKIPFIKELAIKGKNQEPKQ